MYAQKGSRISRAFLCLVLGRLCWLALCWFPCHLGLHYFDFVEDRFHLVIKNKCEFILFSSRFALSLQKKGVRQLFLCACGEIGRRARLRIWCLATCRFESYQAHKGREISLPFFISLSVVGLLLKYISTTSLALAFSDTKRAVFFVGNTYKFIAPALSKRHFLMLNLLHKSTFKC